MSRFKVGDILKWNQNSHSVYAKKGMPFSIVGIGNLYYTYRYFDRTYINIKAISHMDYEADLDFVFSLRKEFDNE